MWSQKARAPPAQQPSYNLNQSRAPQQPQQSGYGAPPQNYNNRGQPYDNRPRYQRQPANNNQSQSSQQPPNQSLSKPASQSNKTSVSAQTDNNVNINNVPSNPTDNINVDQSQQNQNAPDVIPNDNNKPDVQVSSSAVTQSQSISTQQSQVDNKQNDDALGADTSDHQSLASGTTPKKKPYSQSSINNKMLFGTRYEVKCDETFAYYEGWVFDYDEEEEKLRVAYPWKADQLVPVNYVRPLAPSVDPNWKPKQGDHVECQAKAEESEPYGWWDCTIKTVRDNLYLITYEGWDNHHEVLQHNMLRPYNDQEPFEDEGIVREFMDITKDKIQDFKSSADLSNQSSLHSFMNQKMDLFGDDAKTNKSATTITQLKSIAKRTNLIHLNFNPETEKLLLIGSQGQVRDAKMLIHYVWSLRESYRKKEEQVRNDEAEKQRIYDDLKKCVQVKFKFHRALTKYLIGTKGENIQKAKDIEGVEHINVMNYNNDIESVCLILAKDQHAADEARAILEMEQGEELIPADPNLRKELIGRDGNNIKQLEERSHVLKICTLEHLQNIIQNTQSFYNRRSRDNYQREHFINVKESNDPNFIKLIIIGPKEKVPFAKMLIKSQVKLIQEKFVLLERRNQARKDYHGDDWNDFDNGNGYDDNYNNNNNNNNRSGPQSARRQKRREQSEITQRSDKDTMDYDYTQNQPQRSRPQNPVENIDDENYPSLGTKAPHVVNDQNQETSWVDHDEADDGNYFEEAQDDQYDDNTQQVHGGRGRGARYDGGYDDGYNNYDNYGDYGRGYGDEQQGGSGGGYNDQYQSGGGGGGGGGVDVGFDDQYQEEPQQSYRRGGGYKSRGRSGGNQRGRGGGSRGGRGGGKPRDVWKPKDKSQNSSQSNQEANASSNQ